MNTLLDSLIQAAKELETDKVVMLCVTLVGVAIVTRSQAADSKS